MVTMSFYFFYHIHYGKRVLLYAVGVWYAAVKQSRVVPGWKPKPWAVSPQLLQGGFSFGNVQNKGQNKSAEHGFKVHKLLEWCFKKYFWSWDF